MPAFATQPPHQTTPHRALPADRALRRRYFGLLGRAQQARSSAQRRKLIALATALLVPIGGQVAAQEGRAR